MKPSPQPLKIYPLFAAGFLLLVCLGCAASQPSLVQGNYYRTAGHPASPLSEIRSQQISERARSLYASGKFKNRADAHTAAEHDFPTDTFEQAAAQQYEADQKRRATQEKFENDLRKVVFDNRR